MDLNTINVDVFELTKRGTIHINLKLQNLKLYKFRFWLAGKIIKVASWIIPFSSIDVFTDVTKNTPGRRI